MWIVEEWTRSEVQRWYFRGFVRAVEFVEGELGETRRFEVTYNPDGAGVWSTGEFTISEIIFEDEE